MKFAKVNYEGLNAKQKEIFNFQILAGILAAYGFACLKISDDWQGCDFLAYRFNGTETLKVQLKSRVAVYEKYQGKNIWMAFPAKGSWYLIEHDVLLTKVSEATNWLNTSSWIKEGGYNADSPNAKLLESIEDYKL